MIVESDSDIAKLLTQCRTIAVVGLSAKPDRPSYEVAHGMQAAGIRVVPVNPTLIEVLGEKAYPVLASIPFPVDMVNCFRRAEDMPEVAVQLKAMKVAPQVLWMQLGITSLPAAQIASDLGIKVVIDRCWKIERRRLGV
jgi:uncharacterized protein